MFVVFFLIYGGDLLLRKKLKVLQILLIFLDMSKMLPTDGKIIFCSRSIYK